MTARVTAAASAVVTGLVDARITYEVRGAPLYRTPAGTLIAPIALTVRVLDGRAELDLAGVPIDPRTLDPAQPEHRTDARVPIALAPGWVTAKIAAALGGRHV